MNTLKSTKYLIIGICGPSSSGKSFFAKHLHQTLKNSVVLNMDDYFKDYATQRKNPNINWDDPCAVDFELLIEDLKQLMDEKIICSLNDNLGTHIQTTDLSSKKPDKIIILEGIFIFQNDEIRTLLDKKIYLDVPQFKCFFRRIHRDCFQKGQNIIQLIKYYFKNVFPCYIKFIKPFKADADIIFIKQNTHEMIEKTLMELKK